MIDNPEKDIFTVQEMKLFKVSLLVITVKYLKWLFKK